MPLNSANHDKIKKNSIVTTGTTYLDIDTFPAIVIKITFSLRPEIFLVTILILDFVMIH